MDILTIRVRLPGDGAESIWLPLDSKFNRESYDRLKDAADRGDMDTVEKEAKELERQIKKAAGDISEKYISPPYSTDFGVMFLPTEGLFLEVIRRPGLTDFLQHEYRVTVAGPTTLAALLSALQLGFRTLERFPERLNRWGDSHSHTNRIQGSYWEKGPVMDGKTVLERSSRTRCCDN
jgi:DNA anti-recombination protein RmuC